jgi:hypothetical protein
VDDPQICRTTSTALKPMMEGDDEFFKKSTHEKERETFQDDRDSRSGSQESTGTREERFSCVLSIVPLRHRLRWGDHFEADDLIGEHLHTLPLRLLSRTLSPLCSKRESICPTSPLCTPSGLTITRDLVLNPKEKHCHFFRVFCVEKMSLPQRRGEWAKG